MEWISLIFWILCGFRQRSNFSFSKQCSRFFIVTFDWDGNFEFWWFHRNDQVHIYQGIPYLLCDYVNSDDFIGKITYKSNQTTTSFHSKIVFEVNTFFFFSEKNYKFRLLYLWLCPLVFRRGFLIQCAILLVLLWPPLHMAINPIFY